MRLRSWMTPVLLKVRLPVSAVAVLALALIALTGVIAAEALDDATLSAPVIPYAGSGADVPSLPQAVAPGDVAEGDVAAVGTALQYIAVVLNGDGVNPDGLHPFLKVQSQGASGSFDNAACYLGNNASAGSFGLGTFALSQHFQTAHMKATRAGSVVTIEFTNVNGGSLANQTYVCSGAPPPVGTNIGVAGFADATATIDNFGDGTAVLDTFSFVGPLGSTGNWNDAAPGMNAVGGSATGGPRALSFWIKAAPPPTVPVPTLSEWAIILMTALLVGFGVWSPRGRFRFGDRL